MEDFGYPNLHEMVRREGVCPICLMEMGHMPKYECENGHVMCHRCKPYYYACSTCNAPMSLVLPEDTDPLHTPPPIHFMPHPMPGNYEASAPNMSSEFFVDYERRRPWGPPTPEPDQHLIECSYTQYGCWIRIPEYIKEIHESRCQFRPFLEEEHLPTDLPRGDYLIPCTYASAGCHIVMPPWRQPIHEPICSFKERFEGMNAAEESEPIEEVAEEDPNELVECKLKIYGCLVRMPRRRKEIHEQKCNYVKYYKEEDFVEPEEEEAEPEGKEEEEEEVDLEMQVDCRWAEQGCPIRPKLYRKETHEEKCNYKLEECSFKDNGCEETFVRSKRYTHERTCDFKD